MSTLDRLRQLVRPAGPAASPPAAPARELTYEQLDRDGNAMPERRDLPPLDGASIIDTPAGPCIVIDRIFEPHTSHGRLAVEEAEVSASDVVAFCDNDRAALMGSRWREGLGRQEAAEEEEAAARMRAGRRARARDLADQRGEADEVAVASKRLRVAGAQADGTRLDGTRVNGGRVDGGRVDGSRVNGSRADGSWADGGRADGGRADGDGGRQAPINPAADILAEATDLDAEGRPVIFLDLETTGLSGGAGTVAFLVGCGFFRDGAFHTRQFFLTGFAAERAMLHAVTTLLSEAACLVTYNGKTFDVPVMETRWLFHRVPPPWTELTHLDMVHVSRRLWRARNDIGDAGCRLVMLEHDLFGVVRHGDVPGFEIPGRYFGYIRGGEAEMLEPVLHHNRLDLLSLAFLTARALRLLREGASGAHDPQECLALGRELVRLRDDARADACFRAAAESPFASASVRAEALYALARHLRRARRYHEAAMVWRRLVSCNAPRDVLNSEAREALAVHYEHRDRNLDAAHEWATDAYRTESDTRRRDAFAHRLARLKRKMAVHTKGGPQTAFEWEFSLGLDE